MVRRTFLDHLQILFLQYVYRFLLSGSASGEYKRKEPPTSRPSTQLLHHRELFKHVFRRCSIYNGTIFFYNVVENHFIRPQSMMSHSLLVRNVEHLEKET